VGGRGAPGGSGRACGESQHIRRGEGECDDEGPGCREEFGGEGDGWREKGVVGEKMTTRRREGKGREGKQKEREKREVRGRERR
jgi:hypothetical protein